MGKLDQLKERLQYLRAALLAVTALIVAVTGWLVARNDQRGLDALGVGAIILDAIFILLYPAIFFYHRKYEEEVRKLWTPVKY